jgi:hypothetical protein
MIVGQMALRLDANFSVREGYYAHPLHMDPPDKSPRRALLEKAELSFENFASFGYWKFLFASMIWLVCWSLPGLASVFGSS